MKPTTRLALQLLRENEQVSTHMFLAAGVGSRFGARLLELREAGFVISQERLRDGHSGSLYRLVAEPDLQDAPRERDEALTAGAASTTARGSAATHVAAVSRDDDGQSSRASGAHLTGPCPVDNANPARAESPRDAVTPAGSRTAGVLFDPDRFGRAA